MEVISITPRGYCQGVVRAIQIVRKTVKENPDRKIHMLGMIVHNRHVVEECQKLGIIVHESDKTREELLDEIDDGIVIFTAHGVSDQVREKAEKKGLTIVDATCPDVSRTHDIVRRHCQHGDVIYIGRPHHPEAEGVVGLSPRVHLVSSLQDIDALGNLSNVLITTQTTLSLLDTRKLIDACLKKYPDAQASEEICHATTIRQEAVIRQKNVDVLFVVGDPHSNNSNQLKEIGLKSGIPHAYLIEDVTGIQEKMLAGAERIAVTSGSSTPTSLTADVIRFLQEYANTGVFQTPIRKSSTVL